MNSKAKSQNLNKEKDELENKALNKKIFDEVKNGFKKKFGNQTPPK